MPLITDYRQVKETYAEAAELGIGLPVFCTEDLATTEAILAATLEFGQRIGVENLPVITSFTVRYPGRQQARLVTHCGDPIVGTRMMFSDLDALVGETSPYRKLRVMPHLDHAFPWLDGDVLQNFADRFASVMCDASERPFAENIRLTAEYVEKVRGRVVVEGAVDEIFESGGAGQKNDLTSVESARRFLRETGVDILVPNVGTEHRATQDQVHYHGERAREISAAVGKILCLHGSSSLRPEDLPHLADDGFVKINIYTTLAVHGGQAVARKLLANLGNIFSAAELADLVRQGVLGEKVLSPGYAETEGAIKPKLVALANPPRRDAWVDAVRTRCQDYLEALNFRRYAR
jgi:fructose/tagatose bisphosphate aldolase